MEVGGNELTIYDNLDPRTGEKVWGDLCRGPHIPTTKHIPAFKLTRSSAAYWRGDQNREDLQRIYGTAWESPEAQDEHLRTARRGRAPRPPQAGSRTRPVHLPRRARLGPAGVPPQGRHHPHRRWRTTPASGTSRRATSSSTPRTSPRGTCTRSPGHLDWYKRRHVPGDAHRRGTQRGRHRAQAGPGLLPQADELPDAQPDLPLARPLVPRTAAAAVRVRLGVPVREVRRGPRPDPRARHDPGRRAHLLHPGADARRADHHPAVRARTC